MRVPNYANEQWATYEKEGKTFVSVDGVGIFPICEVFPYRGDENARLISAAPDLFKALQAALDDHNGIDTNINWQEAARAAIAKAVGK